MPTQPEPRTPMSLGRFEAIMADLRGDQTEIVDCIRALNLDEDAGSVHVGSGTLDLMLETIKGAIDAVDLALDWPRWIKAIEEGWLPSSFVSTDFPSGETSPSSLPSSGAPVRRRKPAGSSANFVSINHSFSAFGETKKLREWADDPRCVVVAHTLKARIKSGLPPEEAMTRPSQKGLRPDQVVSVQD